MDPNINHKRANGKSAETKDSNGAKNEKFQQADKLDLRNEIQEEYRTNPVPWLTWVFDSLELPEGSRVLELGGGTGALWQENTTRIPKTWKIVLSDRSLEMVRKAKSGLLASRLKIGCLNLDSQALPFHKDSFDALLAVGLLDLVPDLNQALGEAWRVLRPSGQFIATAGGKGHLQELEDLLRPFLPDNMVKQIGGEEDRFGLENGEKILSRYFEEVVRLDYPDRLVFTDLEPIMDYVLSEQSIVWAMPLSKLGNFVQRIKQTLAQNGKITVTVRKGMFVARKKVMSG